MHQDMYKLSNSDPHMYFASLSVIQSSICVSELFCYDLCICVCRYFVLCSAVTFECQEIFAVCVRHKVMLETRELPVFLYSEHVIHNIGCPH